MSALLAQLPPTLSRQLRSGRELTIDDTSIDTPRPPFVTRFEGVDRLLRSGFGRGQTTEIIGRRTSGRFSLVLSTLAMGSQAGESVALVDLGGHFDPHAAKAIGIDLERLLWARPRHLKKALQSTEILIQGGFPLVVVDLGTPPVPGGRGNEAGWLRLSRAANDFDVALLISSPYRASGAAAQTILEIEATRGAWIDSKSRSRKISSTGLLYGASSRLALKKQFGRRPGESARVDMSLLPDEIHPGLNLQQALSELRREARPHSKAHSTLPASSRASGMRRAG